jgi:hypothetical protein
VHREITQWIPEHSVSATDSMSRIVTQLAGAPLQAGKTVWRLGRDAERRTRDLLTLVSERALLAALDATVDMITDERVIDRVIERTEAAGIAQRVADRLLEDGIVEQIAERAFSGPELERMLAVAFESALPEEVIAQLLASEAVWILVDEIARSPSVTEAITQQSTGFLDQVAGKARDRSREADTTVQRLAQRLSRRRRHGSDTEHNGEADVNKPLSSGSTE